MTQRNAIRGASISDAIKHWAETEPAIRRAREESAKARAAAVAHDPASNLDRRADIALQPRRLIP